MRSLPAVLILLAAGPAAADAYRWVDANGVVHYSDRPVEGAEVIELNTGKPSAGAQISEPETTAAAPVVATGNRVTQTQTDATGYQSLDIIRPQLGETLWNIGSTLNVALRLEPRLANGHRIQLIYDGQLRGDLPSDSLDITLDNVYRGEHTLQAQVVDVNGNVLTQSTIKRFFVQQNIIRR